MHNIVLDRDEIGRLVVTQATASTMLTDPLDDMHSRARREIIFKPLSSAERQLMKAAKHLDLTQRRVVTHYILSNRRADYQHKQAYLEREAKRLRDQDEVDHENKRQAAHLESLARQAEKQAALDRQPLPLPQPHLPRPAPAPQPAAHHGEWPIDDDQEEQEMGR